MLWCTSAFRSVINHSYQLAPFAVILLLFISLSIIFASIWLSGLRIAIVIILVLVPPLIIFTKTDNYAEAIFALVAGLLTALTITWSWANFVSFAKVPPGLTTTSSAGKTVNPSAATFLATRSNWWPNTRPIIKDLSLWSPSTPKSSSNELAPSGPPGQKKRPRPRNPPGSRPGNPATDGAFPGADT